MENIDYQENVVLHVYTKVSETQAFTQWMTELMNAQADIKETENNIWKFLLHLLRKVTIDFLDSRTIENY
ncbi:DUF1949 domain-containing protein [Tigheibacillus jepli]|uniref:DUF1949 domain-containing protein n=1 Tax=Tigheibacillus jepli TaxID=3035914 RepID=UPI00387E12B9